MWQHAKYITALLSICLLLTSLCFSGRSEVFCHGELEYSNPEIFAREFVLPEGGLYQHCTPFVKKYNLSTTEIEVLEFFGKKYHVFETGSLYVQISESKDHQGVRHIEAFCVALQEPIDPPLIDPFFHNKFCVDFFSNIAKFSQLRHLELYDFMIVNDSPFFPEVFKLSNLEYLGLPYNCKDKHLKNIGNLIKLKFVNASGTNIKGKGLQHLSKLPQLRVLDLRHTQLDSGALTWLKPSKSLETLLLSESNVRNEDLKELGALETLKYITLHRTDVTDEGLKILGRIKNLQYVSLYDTPTTKSGRETLIQSHPGLILNVARPQRFTDFFAERIYVAAYIGDVWAQETLADEYSEGIGTVPRDLIESLKWLFILEARKDEKAKKYVSEKSVNELMKRIKNQLNKRQIEEAHRRARSYLYLNKRSRFKFELERKEGLPLYQYMFDSIY